MTSKQKSLHTTSMVSSASVWSPDSLFQWSIISTNFRKRLFSQIGNLVGHDQWPTVISTTGLQMCLYLFYQRNPQGITSLLTQCESNNTKYKELLSWIFVLSFSSSYSEIYYFIFQRKKWSFYWVFKVINICHVFFVLDLKVHSTALDLVTKQHILFVLTKYYLLQSYFD